VSGRTIALEDLTNRQATEVVQQVARQRESLTVLLSDGSSVEIRPAVVLEPLPELEGSVPAGWKDAIYGA